LHHSLQPPGRFCTILSMTQSLEADLALLHVVGGAARIAPPPGTLAQLAPRRCARGRSDDALLLSLAIRAARPAAPSHLDHLAGLAAEVFFGTPGSVTSALREAAAIVNDQLVDANRSGDPASHHEGHWIGAVLRDNDLYLAQCGSGQAILIRPGSVIRLRSAEAAEKPLGLSLTPHVRYHHVEVRPNDLLILTTAENEVWSEATLSGLATLDLDQAMERLVAACDQDMTGLMARLVHAGSAGLQPTFSADVQAQKPAAPAPRRRTPPRVKTIAGRAGYQALRGLSTLLARVAPGWQEPLRPDALSQRMLALTALVVPIIVVSLAALVYFQKGRREQYQAFLDQAIHSAALAQTRPSAEEARPDWEAALRWIDQAEAYRTSEESQALREQVQSALDELNRVVRLDFRPIVSGGFGSDAEITALAASATDVYVLDARNQIIRHAWGAPERGFEIDATFACLGSGERFDPMGTPVDLVIQKEPGALGAEGVVAIDADGTLLYCAPDREPALAQLSPPDVGWGRIQAIDVYGDDLFVLDPMTNAVWIYRASGGFFSGTPELFFVEEVRSLKGAIDLALAQDELVILYADGRLDRCRRIPGGSSEGGGRIRVECDPDPRFQDDRPGHEPSSQIPGAVAAEMTYSPPPEPSLFFLDVLSNSVFHYSMRLVYQAQYLPREPFPTEVTAMTLGPPNDLYLAAGSYVYHARPR